MWNTLTEALLTFASEEPELIWEHIFTVINTLVCGLIVAIFTSTFLKKKEERTRIAGVIVEKRINSQQEILHFLEQSLFKVELNIENSGKYDIAISELLAEYGLPDPYDGRIQYARFFESTAQFQEFFHGFEDQLATHKLWLDTKVRNHLIFIQLYFAVFNTVPLIAKQVPLPAGSELTEEEFDTVCNRAFLLLGTSCDEEINELMSTLEEKIVDSVYKLELKRPRKSILRNNMFNIDILLCSRRLMNKTIVGTNRENIHSLIADLVYLVKGIDFSEMDEKTYEAFLQQAAPQVYEEMKAEEQEFRSSIEKIAMDCGVTLVKKEELDQYSGQFGIPLSELFEEIKHKKRKK